MPNKKRQEIPKHKSEDQEVEVNLDQEDQEECLQVVQEEHLIGKEEDQHLVDMMTWVLLLHSIRYRG